MKTDPIVFTAPQNKNIAPVLCLPIALFIGRTMAEIAIVKPYKINVPMLRPLSSITSAMYK